MGHEVLEVAPVRYHEHHKCLVRRLELGDVLADWNQIVHVDFLVVVGFVLVFRDQLERDVGILDLE